MIADNDKDKLDMRPIAPAAKSHLRIFYLFIVTLAIIGNIYLVHSGYLSWSVYALIISSIALSILTVSIFKNLKNTEEFKYHNDNLKEVQGRIFEAENKVLPFLRSRNARKLENVSINKIMEEPLNWVLSIFIFWIFFTTESYTKFDLNDPHKLILLMLFSLLQLISLSFALSGMMVVVYKKIKGEKE